jgi:mycothiol system anti-sigma-R factor
MSCGNPHETPCTEVLDLVYSYLDGEMDAPSYTQVKVHLEECGPCLREYGLEEAVKKLVHRHCGHDPVPAGLRQKVLRTIEAVRAQIDVS